MKNQISRKGLKIYILLIFTAILFLPAINNYCLAQSKVTTSAYATLIQQADQALGSKDYANALLLYEKASRARPDLTYASGKMTEINAALEADPNKRAEIFENSMLKAETLFKQKNYAEAKTEYHKAILIDATLQFPKDRIGQISAVYTDPDDQAYFNDALANGDKALAANEFDKAILSYENALTVKPNAKEIKDKITNTRKLQADFKSRSDQSAKSIAAADKLMQNGKLTEARASYQKAIELIPDNAYAVKKIAEIDNFANNKKALQDSYDKSIEKADQFYINRDFASARLKYQEALQAMPGARYPKEMLEKTKSGESALESDQQKYDAALASAENLLKSADYTAALAGFNAALTLKPSETYPKTKIAEIEKQIAENTARKEKFDLAIKNGDLSMQDKNYESAITYYRNALSFLPGEKYPAQKIDEITVLSAQQKIVDENYKKTIAEADKQFNLGKFAEAIAAYNQALAIKPGEKYPQQQLAESQNRLNAFKNKEDSYASALGNGNQLLSELKYTEALTAFKQALTLKPDEKYPKDKSDEINKILARQKSDSDKYSLSVANGEKALLAGNLSLALTSFQEAATVKPSEQYPRDKISEINVALAAKQKTDEKYTTAVNTGDQLFAGKEYNRAKAAYSEAADLKKNEKYPKDQISKIDKIVGELNSLEENYLLAITDGDNNYNDRKYTEAIASYKRASGFKPAEKYPQTQLETISLLLAEQVKLDGNYKTALITADRFFTSKKYEEAIVAYRQASVLKPSEKYPVDKISEAEKLSSDLKSLEESYGKAVAEGDKLVISKEYESAIASFKTAGSLKPAEAYPKQKITEIQAILGKDKADGQRYLDAITQADKLFNEKKYDEAVVSYQAAAKIKPSEKYPIDQVSKIDQLLADQKKLDAGYQKLMADADAQLKLLKYNEARALYSDAAALKPAEKLPKEKIAAVDALLADLLNKDQNYTRLLSDADAGFAAGKYAEALVSYNNALKIKPAETYPKTQIEKVNAQLALQIKLDADYLAALTAADKILAAKNYPDAIAAYRKALELKPSEKYPVDKISEAEKLSSDLKSLEESYGKAVADGDKLVISKEYESAIASFKTAGSLKPTEAYPKKKIAEIQAILEKVKADGQRYLEAITQADKLFNEKKYDEAVVSYQAAAKIKPSEKYPIDQVSKIDQLLADQKKLDAGYLKLMADADAQLKLLKYTEARDLYTNALTLKPTEKLPKDKIAEIDVIRTGIQQADQNYAKAISDADALFAAKKYTEAAASYSNAASIKTAENYPKEQIAKIITLIAGQKKLDDSFLIALASADKLFEAKKYSEAIVDYRKALALKPGEKYPSDKIEQAETQLADMKSRQETYDKAIASGDKKLASLDYEAALLEFKNASAAKPSETYAVQKIAEIQLALTKIKGENERYDAAVALADKFFAGEKYREALEPYQTAGTIKPSEKYPQEQIARVNQLLAAQKKTDDDYQKLLTEAASQLASAKYDEARNLFTNAGALKPAERLPKEKIAEINTLQAALKLKDENYTKTLNSASELYTSKNRTGAISAYEQALIIKPAEKYPQERIVAIKAEIKVIDDNYSKSITLGDSKMTSKNLMEALNAYQAALEIKPDEEYPKAKITAINSALAAQKDELEKMYKSYVSDGDQLAGTKDYAGAKSAFTKATALKPDETYPKQRLTEITKITDEIELARRAEYNKAIGEADKLYNTKIFDLAIDAYEAAALINPGDVYPSQQISKIRKYMADHAIKELYSQTLVISEGNEKKFNFPAIEPRQRKNNYILLKARASGNAVPKVYLNYGKDGQKNGGIVLRNIDKSNVKDYLIRISVQDKWYREDNNWISLFVETGDIEITRVQIAAGDE